MSAGRVLWRGIVYALAAIGTISSLSALQPGISLQPGYTVDKTDALSTGFIVENTGWYTLRDISVNIDVDFVKMPREVTWRNFSFVGPERTIQKLLAGQKSTVFLSLRELISNASVQEADFTVSVQFSPSVVPFKFNRAFRFKAIPTSENIPIVIPFEGDR